MRTFLLATCLLVGPAAAQQPSSVCLAEFDGPVHDPAARYPSPAVLHAVRVAAPIAFTATRVEVFTGVETGPNRVSIFNHFPATGLPFLELGAGTWSMSRVRGWQGANLTTPVTLSAGQTFWVGWHGVTGAQLSVTGGTASPQPYAVSHNGGVSFTGPFTGLEWKLRVYCGSTGHYFVFGTGCTGPGTAAPEIGWDRAPTTGATTRILLEGGRANDFALLILGESNSSWNGSALPFDLFPVGASGCMLRVSVLATWPATTDAAGEASTPLPIPANATLYGLPFYNQWLVHDAAANPFGFRVSSAGAGLVGL